MKRGRSNHLLRPRSFYSRSAPHPPQRCACGDLSPHARGEVDIRTSPKLNETDSYTRSRKTPRPAARGEVAASSPRVRGASASLLPVLPSIPARLSLSLLTVRLAVNVPVRV